MQVTNANGYIFGPNGLQVNGPDGKPKVISGGGSIPHGTASGTDTYTVSIAGATSYADGDAYLVRFTNGNTTASTLNINGLGVVSLYRNNDGELIGGDIEDGAEMLCVYNSTLNVFQVIGTSPNTLLAYVTNAETTTITKGQPVYAFGGQGDRLKVKLAYNTSDATSAQTVGLVLSASIGANQKGFIILNGQLDGLSILPTSTWSDGDPVYLGPTAGSITNVKPLAPNHLVYLGFVTTANNGSAGRMYVRVQNGYEIEELHDVQISGLADNDIIQYDQATDLWQNKSLSNAGIQPALILTTTGSSGPSTLTGSTLNIPQYGGGLTVGTTAIASGTVGRILFEGTGNVLQQSTNLFWDNTNNRLGIGTASPSNTLSISGTTFITSNGSYGISISRSGTSGIGQQIYNSSGITYLGSDSSGGGFLFTSGLPYASFFGSGGNYPTQLGTNGAIRLTIFGGGNVAIGSTTDSGYKLDVNGTIRAQSTSYGIAIETTNNGIIKAAGGYHNVDGTYTANGSLFLRAGVNGILYLTPNNGNSAAFGMFIGANGINVGTGVSLLGSALFQINSTTKGFLPPRMTNAQMLAIATPAAGLIVYDTTNNKHVGYDGTAWQNFY